ncbi:MULTISPECIES: LacI family DNA-binding transcriptional regulator [Nitrospirillum]|uniref:Transcriptional regulator n=2 Tax=Nitrospirillum TaxID=1543705 RepID=A0A248JXX8_9PROT|nr:MULTISPECIES: LacI family DNA-binding transcriptional regulator [Nitrospirillum]ASG23351.1 transcriptional regulator [Nitrospirillum amazonense CBAmc]EGX99901.1 LacI family transcriptional regulator [Nitrospirillum amazonense Y2]MDG3443117.1 LacI family DNA-binding transcriptional regulator [Nitrospirillum amazonense]MEA1651701.1 LacI family DNA-binding transcriptional regulator [Nitrospirillum sp. BR 11164]MEC4595011.1 LacI family DNA-binding transcriptional regulator [Nitrospirillum amazo
MAGPDRKPTIIDVARLAGASIKTVSRVINKERYVSPDMQERIEKAVAELGYQPNMMARSLASERSNLIGHLYGDAGGPYTLEIQVGLLNRCRAHGYHLMIEEIDYRSPNVEQRASAIVNQMRLDGVVLTAPVTDNPIVLRILEEAGVPYVRVTPQQESETSPSVRIDERQAAYTLTQHLLALGHRRIGFIKGKANHTATILRYTGYCEALTDAGVTVDPVLVEQGEFTYASAVACARRLLDQPHRPTAIFASNDEMAAAVVAEAHNRGFSLPANLSVVGFDDTPLAEMMWPPLTTVRQPVREMAETAADILIGLLSQRGKVDWPKPVPHQVLAHTILLRQSTARPPGKA